MYCQIAADHRIRSSRAIHIGTVNEQSRQDPESRMAESANIHGSGASQVRQSQPRNSLHAKRERNRSLPNPDSHPDNSDLDINVSVMSNGEDVQENSRTPRQDSTHRQISKDTPRHTTIQKSSDFNKNQLQRYPSEPRLPASAL